MTMRSWIRQFCTRPVTRTLRKAPQRVRLTLEALEDRWCPSTFTVTNTLDDGSTGSLRWAIGQANSNAGADTIDFDSTVFSTPQTITLGGTELTVTPGGGPTTITGPAAGVTISGGGLSRVFNVFPAATASFSGLTITGGKTGGNGGGLLNSSATTTLTNCTISGNMAGNGGGLELDGPATLSNCTISGNVAGTGGGLELGGPATLSNCTITGNSATGNGGGVFNYQGTSTLTNCTISGNSATGNGGGVVQGQVSGTTVLTGCTLSGNTATYGGGMYINEGTIALTNCTITGSSANYGGGGFAPSGTFKLTNCTISGNSAGGGLVSQANPVTLGNTIIAGNTGGDVGGGAGVNSQGHNLIGVADGVGGLVGSDLTGTSASPLDPLLQPLGYYGGPTQTLAFAPGSPAENAGAAVALTTLTAAIPNAAATSITVADTTGMGPGLYIRIDNEIMLVTGVTNSTTLAVARGQLGTAAAAHATTGVNVTPATDQRGFVRGANVDIGAWENQSQLFTLTPPASNPTPDAGNAAGFALGSFTHASTNNVFFADVDWGDSTSSVFAATHQGNLSNQSHTYQSAGSPAVTVTMFDNDYNFASTAFGVTVNPPITFGTTSLPGGMIGSAYSQSLGVGGGAGGSYTYTTTGNLDGLAINASGTLVGLPTSTGSFLFTVTASDSGGSATRAYVLVVNAPLSITTASLPNGTIGFGYTQLITASGGSGGYSFSVSTGSLPTGLTLNPNGLLSGTPTSAVGSPFAFTIEVTDSNNGTATQNYSVTITPPTSLTVTGMIAANKGYDGNNTAIITSYGSLLGIVGGDDVSLNTSAAFAAFSQIGAGTGLTVTVTGLTLTGADAGKYILAAAPTTTADINKANATLNVSGYTGTYDGAAHGASGTARGVLNETLSDLDLGASFTNVPGGTANWTFTDVTGNYNNASGSVSIVINAVPPTANGDFASIAEDSVATSVPVLANDAGTGLSITSVTQGLFGSVAITGGGTGLTYQPAAGFTGVDSFTYTINGTATATVLVAVTPVNDKPVLVAPSSATILPNQVTNLAGITVNDIDIDAGSAQLQVALSGGTGTLTLGSVAGLTFTSGDGSDDSAMTFTGTLASINNALAGLTYRQLSDTCTADSVSILIDDLGNSGSGGNKTDSASITISPPYNTVQLLPDPFKLNTKALVVIGTNAADTITVKPVGISTTSFTVTINGTPTTVSGVTGRILVFGQDGDDTITMSSTVTRQTYLSGGAGKDTISGSSGIDWISGGLGDDSLKGNAGVDRFVESGDVSFTLVGGTTTTDGSLTGLGNDVLYRNSIESAKLTGGAGNNTFNITGFIGATTVDGGAGSDTLIGRNVASAWTITADNGGKVGNASFSAIENLTGGTLNDTFKFSNGKSVAGTIDGGTGTNKLDYALYTTALRANLLLGTATGTGGIANISNVAGGAGNDVLVGNASNNVLSGGAGRNLLIGGAGKDTAVGGAGEDILIGGTTDHDNNPANLDAIMAAWAAALPYATRITNLATLLSASTVHDDSGAIDMLTGGLGSDWFITSAGDVTTDKAAAETKTAV